MFQMPASTLPTVAARRGGVLAQLTVAAVLFVCGTPATAKAEVVIAGSVDAVHMQARDSSTAEALTALNRAFGLQYRTSIVLNQPINGTFEGSLLQVLSRLLDRYNFVVKTGAGSLQVLVLNFTGKDSDKVISTLITSYPDPMWRARSYSRSLPPTRLHDQHSKLP